MVSSVNSAAPMSALTKMGVSPTNALDKYNVNIREHNSINLNEPQVRKPSVTDIQKPNLLTTRGSKVDFSA